MRIFSIRLGFPIWIGLLTVLLTTSFLIYIFIIEYSSCGVPAGMCGTGPAIVLLEYSIFPENQVENLMSQSGIIGILFVILADLIALFLIGYCFGLLLKIINKILLAPILNRIPQKAKKCILMISLPVAVLSIILLCTLDIFFLYPNFYTSFSENFTFEAYKKINIGMDKSEVEKLLGDPVFTSERANNSDYFMYSYATSKKFILAEPSFLLNFNYMNRNIEIKFYKNKVKEINDFWNFGQPTYPWPVDYKASSSKGF